MRTFFEEFARMFFAEALKDLKRAGEAFKGGDYPEVVFHAGQAVGKAVKAMIEAKREYVMNHGPALASQFSRLFMEELGEDLDTVVESLGWFMEYYTRSRYPFVLRGEVISPEGYIGESTANEALERCRRVVSISEEYLRAKGLLR